MNAFLSIVRRFALGGIIISILSLILKAQGVASNTITMVLIISIIVYILFAFFSWLRVRNSINKYSNEYNLNLPQKNFFAVFFRGLLFDIISPIEVIVNLIKKANNPVIMFIATYFILIFYIIVWFVIVK